MALKINNAAEVTLLGYIMAGLGAGCRLRLFRNDYTPTDTDTLANFQEAQFPGYLAPTLAAWGAPASSGGVAQVTHPAQTFTRGAGGSGDSIYGYMVTDGAGNLLWAERDPAAPVNMNGQGNTYTVTPVLTYHSEF